MHVSWSIAKPLKTLLYSNSTLVLITETEKQTESYSLASLPVPAGCRPPVNGAQVSRPEVNLGTGARHNAAHCWTGPGHVPRVRCPCPHHRQCVAILTPDNAAKPPHSSLSTTTWAVSWKLFEAGYLTNVSVYSFHHQLCRGGWSPGPRLASPC